MNEFNYDAIIHEYQTMGSESTVDGLFQSWKSLLLLPVFLQAPNRSTLFILQGNLTSFSCLFIQAVFVQRETKIEQHLHGLVKSLR